MKKQKMSLSNMQGKLSRAEMKNVMAGKLSPQMFNCACSDGSYSWSASYSSTGDIALAINNNCSSGGTCNAA